MRLQLLSLPLAASLTLAAVAAGHAQSPAPEASPAENRRLVAVWGDGEARGTPDLAVTTLTVLRSAETAAAALDEANTAAAAVAEAMRGFGLESRDLQTGGFSITPQYRYENRPDGTSVPPTVIGYEVRNSLTVRVRDLDRLGEILDRAVELGVNEGGNISFSIEDPADLMNEARRDAVTDARASAETLAQAAGVALGDVVSISDEPGFGGPVPVQAEMRMMASSAPAVPIETGETILTARIRVVFELSGAAAPR